MTPSSWRGPAPSVPRGPDMRVSDVVKCTFDPMAEQTFPASRLGRILWGAIAPRHLVGDQDVPMFDRQGILIENAIGAGMDFDEFLREVERGPLQNFGRVDVDQNHLGRRPPDIEFWRDVYEIAVGNRSFKIAQFDRLTKEPTGKEWVA